MTGPGPEAKILSVDALVAERDRLRREGRTVVQCHGCFDIVHPGHIRHLSFARSQGDVLVVTITADSGIDKGFDRPYIHEDLRAENLAALASVDYVAVDPFASALPILQRLQPDVYVKGKEYETNLHPHFLKEKEFVESYGGKVIYSSGDVVYSSTFIINEFRERFDLEHERVRHFCQRNEITRTGLQRTLERMGEARVLVIGDAVQDCYVHCDVLGVAAEGPVLNVTPLGEERFVGAAALVAGQVAALGAHATLLTVLEPGPTSDGFRAELDAIGVETVSLEVDPRPLFQKTRYLVDDAKVFKVNRGRPIPLSSVGVDAVVRALDERLATFHALDVIDFGYGFFSSRLPVEIATRTERLGIPYYVDVSHTPRASILRFRGHRIGTPTEDELRFAFADHESGLSHLASRFYAETDGEQLVLTMGRRGVVSFSRPPTGGPEDRLLADYLPSLSREAVDPVGAGDVFHAGVVLADLAGASIQQAIYLGSCLAALHVQRVGNRPVSVLDLTDFLDRRPELVD